MQWQVKIFLRGQQPKVGGVRLQFLDPNFEEDLSYASQQQDRVDSVEQSIHDLV